MVLEEGNTINVYVPYFGTSSAKTIEVFDKSPTQTIQEAITEKFLNGYNTNDCFVVTYGTTKLSSEYVYLGISYPPSTNPNDPWENISKCPRSYSELNGVRPFIFNPQVPDKYIFIELGQDSITTDGTSNKDWSSSVQILE